jgi:hypothetical protein
MSFVNPPPSVQSSKSAERPKIGDWNHFEMMIGKRGMGKSTLMLERMLDLDAIAGGSYKLAHSMGQRFPAKLPSGRQYQLHYYPVPPAADPLGKQDASAAIKKLDNGLRKYPDDIHVLVSDDAQPILEYAQQLGRAVKRHALGFFARRSNPLGRPATPIIVGIDEMVALDAAMGSAQGKDAARWFRKLIISLRHEHIALLAGIQDSNCVSYINAGLATKLWCFKTTHLYAIQSLRAGGMPNEQLESLPNLKKGEKILVDLDEDGQAATDA